MKIRLFEIARQTLESPFRTNQSCKHNQVNEWTGGSCSSNNLEMWPVKQKRHHGKRYTCKAYNLWAFITTVNPALLISIIHSNRCCSLIPIQALQLRINYILMIQQSPKLEMSSACVCTPACVCVIQLSHITHP